MYKTKKDYFGEWAWWEAINMDMFVLRSLEEILFMCGDTEIHTYNSAHQGENIPLNQIISLAVLPVDQNCII